MSIVEKIILLILSVFLVFVFFVDWLKPIWLERKDLYASLRAFPIEKKVALLLSFFCPFLSFLSESRYTWMELFLTYLIWSAIIYQVMNSYLNRLIQVFTFDVDSGIVGREKNRLIFLVQIFIFCLDSYTQLRYGYSSIMFFTQTSGTDPIEEVDFEEVIPY